MKVLNLLAPLCETGFKRKSRRCFQLLHEAKSGTEGHGCLKALRREDIRFSTIDEVEVFSTPQSRKLGTSIGEKWYSTLRSLL